MNTNQQPISPVVNKRSGEFLEVHSIFETIQGEGCYVGRPAWFIRLSGCNLQCSFCDTEYTGFRKMDTPSIAAEIIGNMRDSISKPQLVVITGGEPLRQNIAPLVLSLIRFCNMTVQIETNGTLPLPPILSNDIEIRNKLTVVCSPKTPTIHKNISPHYFKYLVSPKRDFGGLYFPPDDFPRDRIYINPLDEGGDEKFGINLRYAADLCLRKGYTLGIQLHKLAELP